jgi:amino acid transporter
MLVHTIGSLGTFLAFLVAAFSLPRLLRQAPPWKPFLWPSLVLAIGSVITGFLRTGDAPGVGQRLGFACFFLWIALIGYALYRDPDGIEGAAETL